MKLLPYSFFVDSEKNPDSSNERDQKETAVVNEAPMEWQYGLSGIHQTIRRAGTTNGNASASRRYRAPNKGPPQITRASHRNVTESFN